MVFFGSKDAFFGDRYRFSGKKCQIRDARHPILPCLGVEKKSVNLSKCPWNQGLEATNFVG
jgi:hypothetical protein